MADLEEPILPTAAASAGHTFMNAFYAAAQIAGKRRQLEEQITKMDMQMGLAEQKHELDTEKLGWQMKYQAGELQRQNELAQNTMLYHDIMAKHSMDDLEWKMNKSATENENIGKLRDRLTSVFNDESLPAGTQARKNAINSVATEFNGLGKAAEPVWRDFYSREDKSTKQAHQLAASNLSDLKHTLTAGSRTPGHPWTLPDLGLDPKYHIPDKDSQGNETLGIAEHQDPNTKAWTPITKEDIKKGVTPDRWRTINKNAHDAAKPLYDQVSGIMSGDPNKMPATPREDGKIGLPRNPADRIPNKVYQSAVGPVMWDGEHLIKQ